MKNPICPNCNKELYPVRFKFNNNNEKLDVLCWVVDCNCFKKDYEPLLTVDLSERKDDNRSFFLTLALTICWVGIMILLVKFVPDMIINAANNFPEPQSSVFKVTLYFIYMALIGLFSIYVASKIPRNFHKNVDYKINERKFNDLQQKKDSTGTI